MRQECKQLKQMIVEIDELTEFNELSDELQQLITEGCIQWPQGQLHRSNVVDGKRLILILSHVPKDQLEDWITNGYNEVDLGISWRILAHEDEVIEQEEILPYIQDDISYNEDGDVIFTPVMDLAGKLPTWSGRNWKY